MLGFVFSLLMFGMLEVVFVMLFSCFVSVVKLSFAFGFVVYVELSGFEFYVYLLY